MATDSHESRDDVLAQIEDIRRKARQMSLKLQQVVLRRTDDRGLVTATANGFGRLLSIDIAEPVTHPEMLGAQITSAIRSCRHAARTLQDGAGQAYLPGLGSMDSIRRAFRKSEDVPSPEELPDFDSARDQVQIIEAVESLNKVIRFNQSADRAIVSLKVASGACEVRINVANSYVKVLVDSELVGSQNYKRLSPLIVEAIAKLEDRCAKLRQEALNKVRISDTSAGQLITQALDSLQDGEKEKRDPRMEIRHVED